MLTLYKFVQCWNEIKVTYSVESLNGPRSIISFVSNQIWNAYELSSLAMLCLPPISIVTLFPDCVIGLLSNGIQVIPRLKDPL